MPDLSRPDLPYRLLADMVLALHVIVAAFVVVYPLLVVCGALARHPRLAGRSVRVAHGAIVALIVVQAWLGHACLLTTLEGWLRMQASGSTYDAGFVEFWLGRILFYEAPAWVFIAGYTGFGALVAMTWWRCPPAPCRRPGIALLVAVLAVGLAACTGTGPAANPPAPAMDMARMCDLHELMMAGSSPEEQQTMLEQHLKAIHGSVDAAMVERHRQTMAKNCPSGGASAR